ncbi:AfsR/SARP family transcriptional regulator [Dactylosporangium sp. NPDC005572]|uniref:AfsR/SARP family transcriptional regulator n=1 Tax=Dactylosporangium sp. NPDC005572 TaxID=3156889 RepID=UPI0033B266BA
MTQALRFAVLGPVRAWLGDAELPLGSPQQRAVLVALLLREGGAATIDQLVAAVWDTEPPTAARATVRTYVSRLRQILVAGDGEPLLGSTAGLYRLRVEPGALDAAAFAELVSQARASGQQGDAATAADRLRSAAALWQGEPLGGVPGPYAEAQRARLERERRLAVEARLAFDIDTGRHAVASAELTGLVAEQPLDEGLRRLLMLAQYRTGRPAAAVAQFHEIRALLADEFGLDPGGALQELYRRVLVADPTLTTATPAVTTPAIATRLSPAPAQLPTRITDFVGRAALLAELNTTLGAERDTGAAKAIGLTGLPGVGTSTLAIHVAYGLRDRFSDGQLYADLRGAHPADPAPILGRFLRALGVAATAIPGDLHERVALWRSVTAERRVLVVLDHAESVDQVRHLLPSGSWCATLLTAGRRLTGLAGVAWRMVPVFDAGESLELLRRVAGPERVAAEPESARRFAASCSHIPLAVRIAAERLLARPMWSVADIERRLRIELRQPMRLYPDCEVVEAPLERRYDDLEPPVAKAFCLAALPDHDDVTAADLATHAGLALPDAERFMEQLVDEHLVEPVTTGRYRYHTLVRWFARRKATGELGRTIAEAGLDEPVLAGAGYGDPDRSRLAVVARRRIA